MHTVSIDPFAARPWEVGDAHRAELLAWFLDAEFTTADDFERLLELTGRRLRFSSSGIDRAIADRLKRRGVSDADIVWPGHETGNWKAAEPVARATFIELYAQLQRYLREAESYWQRAMAERSRGERELLAQLALGKILEERSDVTPLDLERDPQTGAIVWPSRDTTPAPVRRSTSLAGELALALFDQMHGAQTAGLCKVCGRPWLSPFRKRRRLCFRDECSRAWRNAHRRPEDPAAVYERVKRSRARRRKGAKDDTTRKR